MKSVREESQVQQAAVGDEMKEQLVTVTAERDQALSDLQSARGEVSQLQERQSGLELEVVNMSKDRDEEGAKVNALRESLGELQARINQVEKEKVGELQALINQVEKEKEDQEREKKSLEEELEVLRRKQNDLLSDGENRLKEELERARAEMEALKSKAEEVSRYETAIADWQAWAGTQTEEFAKLQGCNSIDRFCPTSVPEQVPSHV